MFWGSLNFHLAAQTTEREANLICVKLPRDLERRPEEQGVPQPAIHALPTAPGHAPVSLAPSRPPLTLARVRHQAPGPSHFCHAALASYDPLPIPALTLGGLRRRRRRQAAVSLASLAPFPRQSPVSPRNQAGGREREAGRWRVEAGRKG